MYKSASRNAQRRREHAKYRPKVSKKKKRFSVPTPNQPKASKLLAKGYEPTRDDPAKVAEKLTRRMRGVTVEVKRRGPTLFGTECLGRMGIAINRISQTVLPGRA